MTEGNGQQPPDPPDRPTGGRVSTGLLFRRLEETDARVGALREAVRQLTDGVQAMAVQAARVRPIHWPHLAPGERAERDAELLAWLREVWVTRYPQDAEAMTGCWWRHPAAVDLLTATWQSWVNVYANPAASTNAQVQWMQVTRPTTSSQLRGMLGGCGREHVDDPDLGHLVTGTIGW